MKYFKEQTGCFTGKICPLAALFCLLPVLFHGAASAAGWDVSRELWFGYMCEDIKKPYFAPSVEVKGEFLPQRQMAIPEKFSMPKEAGVKRVFVVGESVAWSMGSGAAVFSVPPAGKKTPQSAAGRVEIINCGMGGYGSQRTYDVLKEILKYSPDLIVVLSGNIELFGEPCPGFRFGLQRSEFRLFTRLYSLKYGPGEAEHEASLRIHAARLAKMAGAAKEAGVPIMFCTLPHNIRDWPEFGRVPFENTELAAGYVHYYSGRLRQAAEGFRRVLLADPGEPAAVLYLAKTLEKLGRKEESAVYFLKRRAMRGTMSNLALRRNARIRETAAAGGACVADLERLFFDISPAGGPGLSEFLEDLHWRKRHDRLVWEKILGSAADCRIPGFAKTAPENFKKAEVPLREESLKRLAYAFAWLNEQGLNESSLFELAYIRKVSPGLLQEAGGSPEKLYEMLADMRNIWGKEKRARVETFFPFFLEHLAETERRSGDRRAALALCERALALLPGNEYLLLERAQVLADSGRLKDAGKDFQRLAGGKLGTQAVSLRTAYGLPGPVLPVKTVVPAAAAGAAPRGPARASEDSARKSRQLSDAVIGRMRSGDFAAAEEELGKALELDAANPEALITLCSEQARKNKKEAAVDSCRKAAYAVYAFPGRRRPGLETLAGDALFEAYALLKELGRAQEARVALEQAAKMAPVSWPKLGEARAKLKAEEVK